jgi:formate hydrogenlyase subunit 4
VLCLFFCLSSFFILCPMLPISLDCPFFILLSVFSSVYLFCVFCTQCCQWIVKDLSVHSIKTSVICILLIYPVASISFSSFKPFFNITQQFTFLNNFQKVRS